MAEEAASNLRSVCTASHGFPARRFIKVILKMTSDELDALPGMVKRYTSQFMNEAGAGRGNETAMRIAKPFELTSTAAGLARKAAIIDNPWVAPDMPPCAPIGN